MLASSSTGRKINNACFLLKVTLLTSLILTVSLSIQCNKQPLWLLHCQEQCRGTCALCFVNLQSPISQTKGPMLCGNGQTDNNGDASLCCRSSSGALQPTGEENIINKSRSSGLPWYAAWITWCWSSLLPVLRSSFYLFYIICSSVPMWVALDC